MTTNGYIWHHGHHLLCMTPLTTVDSVCFFCQTCFFLQIFWHLKHVSQQNSELRHFLFNPFDTLSKVLLQIYTYKLKYGLGRHLLRQNICHWHRSHPMICYKSKYNYLLDNSELTLLRFGLLFKYWCNLTYSYYLHALIYTYKINNK